MYLTKGELVGIIIIVLSVLGYKAYYGEEPTPVTAEDSLGEAQGSQHTDKMSLVDPFAPDTWLDSPINPELGLTIEDGNPPCVDTHLRTDVSCADKEAILKFRNALQDAEIKRLEREVDKLELEIIYEEFGLQEC